MPYLTLSSRSARGRYRNHEVDFLKYLNAHVIIIDAVGSLGQEALLSDGTLDRKKLDPSLSQTNEDGKKTNLSSTLP